MGKVTIPPGYNLNNNPIVEEKSTAGQTQATLNWANPEDIQTTLLPVQKLSPDFLPDALRPWLVDIANRMKCPLDFLAATLVVMTGSLIGTQLTIKPKKRDDWLVVPNIWGAVIGDPSALKTPSIMEVFKPLKRLVNESTERYEKALLNYEAEIVTYDTQKKVYQEQEKARLKGKPADNPVNYPEAPVKPIERRYMTNDATIEKLAEILNQNPVGILEFRDELIGLLAGWDRAGREQDRAFHLEGWNGNGNITIDRIGRGTLHVKNLCLSLFGGIQPAKLSGYLQAATGYENDGFVQRLQVAVYPDKADWEYLDEYPDKQARDNAYNVIQAIAELNFGSICYAADDYNQYAYTYFDDEAQQVFKDWLINLETVILPRESGLLLEHFAKYRSLMPSLALIFHVLDFAGNGTSPKPDGKQQVSKKAALLAVKWCDYLETHARRIYGLLDTMHLTAAKQLLPHLKNGDLKDGFKVRDVQRKQWSHLTNRDQVQAALDELIDRNWLKEVKPEPNIVGRPEGPSYLINPKILKF